MKDIYNEFFSALMREAYRLPIEGVVSDLTGSDRPGEVARSPIRMLRIMIRDPSRPSSQNAALVIVQRRSDRQ